MSREPLSPEAVAAALPREVKLSAVLRALVALGVPAEVAAWVTELRIDPTTVEVEASTSLRRSTVRVSIPVDDRHGVTWDEVHREPAVAPSEVPCKREGCGDGYGVHPLVEGVRACEVCLCRGFMWVSPT